MRSASERRYIKSMDDPPVEHVTYLPTSADGPIIVFDALCVLCSASAQFILRHDRSEYFRLASMQGETGSELYRRFGIDPQAPESMIVVQGNHVLRDSDAVLAIAAGFGWPWRAFAALRIIPNAVRDPVYRWLARNRYRLFGRHETCWLPSPSQARRVL